MSIIHEGWLLTTTDDSTTINASKKRYYVLFLSANNNLILDYYYDKDDSYNNSNKEGSYLLSTNCKFKKINYLKFSIDITSCRTSNSNSLQKNMDLYLETLNLEQFLIWEQIFLKQAKTSMINSNEKLPRMNSITNDNNTIEQTVINSPNTSTTASTIENTLLIPNTKPRCLIGCSGSVATLKIPELVSELSHYFDVMIICTTHASFFLEKSAAYNMEAWKKFELAGGYSLVLKDEDEWNMWNMIGNSVLHIEMRRWADIFIIAPASANILSKAAYGIADNFVLSIMRAWDFKKPCILCPAMNTAMWDHPTTIDTINRLEAFGWEVLGPVEKLLACNEVGNGAMVSVETIKEYLIDRYIHRNSPLTSYNNNKSVTFHDQSMNNTSTTNSYNNNKRDLTTTSNANITKESLYDTPLHITNENIRKIYHNNKYNNNNNTMTDDNKSIMSGSTITSFGNISAIQPNNNSTTTTTIIDMNKNITTVGSLKDTLSQKMLPSTQTITTNTSNTSYNNRKNITMNMVLFSSFMTGLGVGIGLATGFLVYHIYNGGDKIVFTLPGEIFIKPSTTNKENI